MDIVFHGIHYTMSENAVASRMWQYRRLRFLSAGGDGDGASGRAWLETLDGKCVGRFDVLQASEAVLRLKLHLEAKNAPSECRLAVETFGSKEASESGDARLMRYTRNVKLAR